MTDCLNSSTSSLNLDPTLSFRTYSQFCMATPRCKLCGEPNVLKRYASDAAGLAEAAARIIGLELVPTTAANEDDLDTAFRLISGARRDALLVLNDPVRLRIAFERQPTI